MEMLKPAITRAKQTDRWIEVEVGEILLRPGEYIAVTLRPNDSGELVQVEIHITPEGDARIYCDELKTLPFSEYEHQ